MIYFFQENGHQNLIKIGTTSRPKSRIKRILSISPYGGKVLAIMTGEMSVEKALHRKFQKFHTRGEWFLPDQELLSFIGKIRDDGTADEKISLSPITLIPAPTEEERKNNFLTVPMFMEIVENFLKENNISATRFGTYAVGDPCFVLDIRKAKRTPTLLTVAKVNDFMRNYPNRTGANP